MLVAIVTIPAQRRRSSFETTTLNAPDSNAGPESLLEFEREKNQSGGASGSNRDHHEGRETIDRKIRGEWPVAARGGARDGHRVVRPISLLRHAR